MDPRLEALLDVERIVVRSTNADPGTMHFWGTWHVARATTANPARLDLIDVDIRAIEAQAIDAHHGRLILDVHVPQEK